jgi:hypothetical protein
MKLQHKSKYPAWEKNSYYITFAMAHKGEHITQSHARDNRNYRHHSKQRGDAARQSMFSLSFAIRGDNPKAQRESPRAKFSTGIG